MVMIAMPIAAMNAIIVPSRKPSKADTNDRIEKIIVIMAVNIQICFEFILLLR